MKTLHYFLSLATRGDATAAYEAAKIMHDEKYNEVIVQSMLRKAGDLGSLHAQRWLGFISLCNQYVSPESTTSNITYIKDESIAFEWFQKAALQGDVISAFALYKCFQHGIGTEQNNYKAEELLNNISDQLTIDMLPLMFVFDTYHKPKKSHQVSEFKTVIKELLAS